MPLTKPKAAQVDFDVTNITDPLIRLNSGESGSADKDAGFVIERGDDTNVGLIYDKSADLFALINTNETGTTSGNVTISSYANLQCGIITGTTIKDYSETVYAGGNTSTAVTLDETNGNVQSFTMTGNCTFTMPSGSGLPAGTSLTLILTQDGTGSRTGTFTSVKWPSGTAVTLTTTATSGIDILTFYTFNGGASPVWYGFASGLAMA